MICGKATKFEPQPSGRNTRGEQSGAELPGTRSWPLARSWSCVQRFVWSPSSSPVTPDQNFSDSAARRCGFDVSGFAPLHALGGLPALTRSRRPSSASLRTNCASAEAAGGDGGRGTECNRVLPTVVRVHTGPDLTFFSSSVQSWTPVRKDCWWFLCQKAFVFHVLHLQVINEQQQWNQNRFRLL